MLVHSVVGTCKNPPAFKIIDLAVLYYGPKKCVNDKELFKKWFDEYFVPEVGKCLKEHNLPPKALLLLLFHQTAPV